MTAKNSLRETSTLVRRHKSDVSSHHFPNTLVAVHEGVGLPSPEVAGVRVYDVDVGGRFGDRRGPVQQLAVLVEVVLGHTKKFQ